MMVGDLVTRKSYGNDVVFCILDFAADTKGRCVALLKALYDHTLIADAPIEDLVNVLPQGRL